MASGFTVEGCSALERTLAETGRRAAHQRATLQVQAQQARRLITGVPVDSGALAASVANASTTVTDDSFTLRSALPYAHFVFHGTRYMDAQPPRVPPTVGEHTAQAVADDLGRP